VATLGGFFMPRNDPTPHVGFRPRAALCP